MEFRVFCGVGLFYQCGGKNEHYVWSIKVFFVLSPPQPLLSTVYECDGYLSSWGRGDPWLGCQVLPAISVVSILELAANSGSSRMSQAPNLPHSDAIV